MNNIQNTLITLIRNTVCGTEDVVEIESNEVVCKIAQLAADHDVLNIVSKALLDGNMVDDEEILQQLMVEQYGGVLRYQQQKFAIDRMCAALDDAKVCYVLLKGAVIRELYPEPDMRTSSDIDILVKSEDMDRAAKCLEDKLGYTEFAHTGHDVSYMTDNGVHIELHHTLVSDRFVFAKPLTDAWEHTLNTDKFRYNFDNEFFVYYHYAHMAKHLVNGGFGVRFVLDLWLMMQKMTIDNPKLSKLLEDGKIKKMAQVVLSLAQVWFGNGEHTEETTALENYILDSGVYGVLENSVVVNQRKHGGKLGNLSNRIFIPSDLLKIQYPVLEQHPNLYIWCQMRRFMRIMRRNRRKAIVELKTNQNTSEQKVNEINALFDMLEM